jgi:ABC-type transport system substrate-binding protein
LSDYDEYASSSPADALQKAMAEMKQSKYDPNGTGKCTAAVCQNLRMIPADTDKPETNIIKQDAAKIGLDFKVETYSGDTAFAKCNDPKQKVAVCSGLQTAAGSPDAWGASTDLEPSYIGPNSCCNIGLIGVPTKQLKSFGYTVPQTTPDFTKDVDTCLQIDLGQARNQCFADMDKKASDLALKLPLVFPNQREIISDRVTNYTYDFYGYASLDRIALKQPNS